MRDRKREKKRAMDVASEREREKERAIIRPQ